MNGERETSEVLKTSEVLFVRQAQNIAMQPTCCYQLLFPESVTVIPLVVALIATFVGTPAASR